MSKTVLLRYLTRLEFRSLAPDTPNSASEHSPYPGSEVCAEGARYRLPDCGQMKGNLIGRFLPFCSRAGFAARLAVLTVCRAMAVEAALGFAAPPAANWNRFNFYLGAFPCKPHERYLGLPSGLHRRGLTASESGQNQTSASEQLPAIDQEWFHENTRAQDE